MKCAYINLDLEKQLQQWESNYNTRHQQQRVPKTINTRCGTKPLTREMKRSESEEECNNLKKAVKGRRINPTWLTFSLYLLSGELLSDIVPWNWPFRFLPWHCITPSWLVKITIPSSNVDFYSPSMKSELSWSATSQPTMSPYHAMDCGNLDQLSSPTEPYELSDIPLSTWECGSSLILKFMPPDYAAELCTSDRKPTCRITY